MSEQNVSKDAFNLLVNSLNETVSKSEFKQFTRALNQQTEKIDESLKKLIDSQIEFKNYIVNNNAQHEKTSERITSLAKEVHKEISSQQNEINETKIKLNEVIDILKEREPAWRFLDTTQKKIQAAVIAAIVAAAGTTTTIVMKDEPKAEQKTDSSTGATVKNNHK